MGTCSASGYEWAGAGSAPCPAYGHIGPQHADDVQNSTSPQQRQLSAGRDRLSLPPCTAAGQAISPPPCQHTASALQPFLAVPQYLPPPPHTHSPAQRRNPPPAFPPRPSSLRPSHVGDRHLDLDAGLDAAHMMVIRWGAVPGSREGTPPFLDSPANTNNVRGVGFSKPTRHRAVSSRLLARLSRRPPPYPPHAAQQCMVFLPMMMLIPQPAAIQRVPARGSITTHAIIWCKWHSDCMSYDAQMHVCVTANISTLCPI